jgi:hypothetical protein
MKKNFFVIVALAATATVFGAGFAFGQQDAHTPELAEFMSMQAKLYLGAKPDDYASFAHLYMDAPNHPEIPQQLIRFLIVKAGPNPELQGQAMVIAQNQKLIEQNAEIIELLRLQTKK